jgi:2-hydroxy-3-keto-5-methylthiopentenyl-1-phosphate phosphatase
MSKPKIAICYDFDGTLTPKNMQEYDFFNDLGTKAQPFWTEVDEVRKKNNADQILAYMMLMIETAVDRAGRNKTTRKAFQQYGKSVELLPGVESWFGIVNAYGKTKGVMIEHYVVSSGIKEMIEGTAIGKKFKKIYACSFVYEDGDGAAKWPAFAVNYTTKTQFLFRINKGVDDDNDNIQVNKHLPEGQRRIPFSRIIYIGDGETDVPCMRLVKEKGGHSIAVYAQGNHNKKKEAEELFRDGRVNYVALADYEENSNMKKIVCAIIDKIVAAKQLNDAESRLERIGGRVRKSRTIKADAAAQENETKEG